MPCVISGDKTPAYTSTVGATHSDKGTISLGSITNLALTPGSAEVHQHEPCYLVVKYVLW
jgi:hypothetical protein